MQLKKISDMMHLSPVQFSRRFKRKTGVNPSDFLTSLRINKACMLLAETDYSLAEVAPLCGYENEYYFSRIFKKKLETNPSVYRKMHSEKQFTVL
jgi:AraC-like DNA-binding protein